jgi:flagellar biosynthesis/type III secretory pathway protein FliH
MIAEKFLRNERAKGRSEGLVEGRSEGLVEGRAEERAEIKKRLEAWNARRIEAANRGEPFDEPIPLLDEPDSGA